jgi:23S rRNA (pseudouridine1915-N3)-methyltransferase
MKMLIAMASKSLNDPLLNEGAWYLSRLRYPFTAQTLFLPSKNGSKENQRLTDEGRMLLEKTAGYFRIALTETGQQFSSAQLSHFLEKRLLHSSKTAFILGGAFGLCPHVLEKADATLSLSAFTLPHRMAYLVICEQLYRASEISAGTPYHK